MKTTKYVLQKLVCQYTKLSVHMAKNNAGFGGNKWTQNLPGGTKLILGTGRNTYIYLNANIITNYLLGWLNTS